MSIRVMLGPPLLHSLNPHAGAHAEDVNCTTETPYCTPVDPNYIEEEPKVTEFVTKDSGQRQEYASGMRRDLQDGKPRFDLIFPEGVAFDDQILTRFAGLLARGAEKYGDNNWQLADSQEELARFRASGLRHMIQWACGEVDEDHATAVIFNLMAYENTKRKVEAKDA